MNDVIIYKNTNFAITDRRQDGTSWTFTIHLRNKLYGSDYEGRSEIESFLRDIDGVSDAIVFKHEIVIEKALVYDDTEILYLCAAIANLLSNCSLNELNLIKDEFYKKIKTDGELFRIEWQDKKLLDRI